MARVGDFFEEDEPIEDLEEAFRHGVTAWTAPTTLSYDEMLSIVEDLQAQYPSPLPEIKLTQGQWDWLRSYVDSQVKRDYVPTIDLLSPLFGTPVRIVGTVHESTPYELAEAKLPCGCSVWSHELFTDIEGTNEMGCPPPPPPNVCCGAPGDAPPVTRMCEYGNCVEWYCGVCGVFENSGYGPVFCPCTLHTANFHWNPAERRKLPSPGGREYTRRMRARRRRTK